VESFPPKSGENIGKRRTHKLKKAGRCSRHLPTLRADPVAKRGDIGKKPKKGGNKNVTFSRFFRFFGGSTSQYPRGENTPTFTQKITSKTQTVPLSFKTGPFPELLASERNLEQTTQPLFAATRRVTGRISHAIIEIGLTDVIKVF